MFSSDDWRASHAISHHLYPNLDTDLEASGLEPFVTFLRNRPTNPLAVYLYWWPLNLLIPLQQLLDQWRRYAMRRLRPKPEDFIVWLELLALLHCCGVQRGAALFLCMHGVAMLLIQIVSTPVHRSEFSWTEGCGSPSVLPELEARPAPPLAAGTVRQHGHQWRSLRLPARSASQRHRVPTPHPQLSRTPLSGRRALDFGEHVILSTQEYWTDFCAAYPRLGLVASLYLFAGFNQPVTHHMFPTCDLSKQYLLTAVIHEQADAFGIARHPPKSLFALFLSTAATWHRTGEGLGYRPPEGSREKKGQ